MTQTERVLTDLRNHEWVCARDWYASAIPNARNRISELRKRGFGITSEPCPDVHGPTYFRYQLGHDPEREPLSLVEMR